MNLIEINNYIKEFDHIQKNINSMYRVNIIELYNIFYDEYINKFGSNKNYIFTDYNLYEQKEQQKEDFIFCNINQCIEDLI